MLSDRISHPIHSAKKAAPAAPPSCKIQTSLFACLESKLGLDEQDLHTADNDDRKPSSYGLRRLQYLQTANLDDPKTYKLWTSKIANFK